MAARRSISRSVHVRADVPRVWQALSDPALLSRWLGVAVALEVRPGGVGTAGDRFVAVEHVEVDERLVFWWWPLTGEGEPPSRVELDLAPTAAGTRITVVETVRSDLAGHSPSDGVQAAAR